VSLENVYQMQGFFMFVPVMHFPRNVSFAVHFSSPK